MLKSLALIDRLYLILERGERREKERNLNVREKHQSVALRVQTRKLGMYPFQESNQRPFTLPDDAQPTETHQSGLNLNSC